MLDSEGDVLYVGKARDLRARLQSYFQKNVAAIKTRAMVAKVAAVETTVTSSEAEALLLEQSLIKDLRPPYNILLRDDKSYPYIRVSQSARFPRLTLHRGKKSAGSRFFGPYPSGGAVRDTLSLMEKVFQVRNCSESYFRNRSRPCLQHQIQRCTAPCVGLVSEEEYAQQVNLAVAFLEGRSRSVVNQLSQDMERASQALEFEKAAVIRDKLAAIQAVQQKQHAEAGSADIDVVAVEAKHGAAVITLLMIRGGRVLGHRNYQPQTRGEDVPEMLLSAFLAQYYLADLDVSALPSELIVTHQPDDLAAFSEAYRQHTSRSLRVASNVRGDRAGWLQMAQTNAAQSLNTLLSARTHLEARFAALETLLDADRPCRHIECFDISHTGGEKAVASCVVFDQEGAKKSEYRHFNVSPDQAGDDYAAIEEAVKRRYQRRAKEQGRLPDLLLIDGGKGQMRRALSVLQALEIVDRVMLVGIGKGPSRKPGMEVLYLPDGRELVPGGDHYGLQLLQQVRDEAHRFALTGHRARRAKTRKQSALDEIPGIGPKRRKALLTHFGGLRALSNASQMEIARVPGINAAIAEKIYDWLHD